MILFNPLEQFAVFGLGFGITNLTVFLFLNLGLILILVRYSMEENIIINKGNLIKESLLTTILAMVKENLGEFKYYPLLLSLFLYILVANMIGMVTYSFSPMAQIIVTIGFSMPIMIGITIIGISKHGSKFFALFLPTGTPTWLIPLLVLIELISYVARAFSLGIRLFSNITSGHSLLHILGGFSYKILGSGTWIVFKIIPVLCISVLMGLEIAIGFLQAYVFVVLVASYLKDIE